MAVKGEARSKTIPARKMTAFRCGADQLERITDLARRHGMTRTDYIIAAALGELPAETHELERRVADLERAVKRLDKLAFGGE